MYVVHKRKPNRVLHRHIFFAPPPFIEKAISPNNIWVISKAFLHSHIKGYRVRFENKNGRKEIWILRLSVYYYCIYYATLFRFLTKCRQRDIEQYALSTRNLVEIGIQITLGITYLHSQCLCHKDIATRNCV